MTMLDTTKLDSHLEGLVTATLGTSIARVYFQGTLPLTFEHVHQILIKVSNTFCLNMWLIWGARGSATQTNFCPTDVSIKSWKEKGRTRLPGLYIRSCDFKEFEKTSERSVVPGSDVLDTFLDEAFIKSRLPQKKSLEDDPMVTIVKALTDDTSKTKLSNQPCSSGKLFNQPCSSGVIGTKPKMPMSSDEPPRKKSKKSKKRIKKSKIEIESPTCLSDSSSSDSNCSMLCSSGSENEFEKMPRLEEVNQQLDKVDALIPGFQIDPAYIRYLEVMISHLRTYKASMDKGRHPSCTHTCLIHCGAAQSKSVNKPKGRPRGSNKKKTPPNLDLLP
jgi:hypothetical protein